MHEPFNFSAPHQWFTTGTTIVGGAGFPGTPAADGFYPDEPAGGAQGFWSNCDVHLNLPATAGALQICVTIVSQGVTSTIFTGLVSSLPLRAIGNRLVGLGPRLRGHPSEEWRISFRSPDSTVRRDCRVSLVVWGTESTPEEAGLRPGAGNMPDNGWPVRGAATMGMSANGLWQPLLVDNTGALVVTGGGGGGGGNVTIVSPLDPLIPEETDLWTQPRVATNGTLSIFCEGEDQVPAVDRWYTLRGARPSDDGLEPPAILSTGAYLMGYNDSPEPNGQWRRIRTNGIGVLRVELDDAGAFAEDVAQGAIPRGVTAFSATYGFDRVANELRVVGARPLAAPVSTVVMNGADVPRALDANAMGFFRELAPNPGGSIPGRSVAGITKTWNDWTSNERLATGELVPAHQALLKALSNDATAQVNLIAGQYFGTDRFRMLGVAVQVERVDTPVAPTVGTTTCTPIVDARRNLKQVIDRGSAASGAFVQPLNGAASLNALTAVLRNGASVLRWVHAQIENVDAPAVTFFQLFNRATVATSGVAADYSFRLEVATSRSLQFEPTIGKYFSLGMTYGWSSTRDVYTPITVEVTDTRVEWSYAD